MGISFYKANLLSLHYSYLGSFHLALAHAVSFTSGLLKNKIKIKQTPALLQILNHIKKINMGS